MDFWKTCLRRKFPKEDGGLILFAVQQKLTLHYKATACAQSPSRVPLFVTPQIVARQASLSLGFSRQVYWSGLPFRPLGDLPDPGIKPASLVSPALQADSLLLSHRESPGNSDIHQ